MLQIEIRANGCLVDYVNVKNIDDDHSLCLDKIWPCLYEAEHQGIRYNFSHNQSEGALVCAYKALVAIMIGDIPHEPVDNEKGTNSVIDTLSTTQLPKK